MQTWDADDQQAKGGDVELQNGAGNGHHPRPWTVGARYEDLVLDDAMPGHAVSPVSPSASSGPRDSALQLPRVGVDTSGDVREPGGRALYLACIGKAMQVLFKVVSSGLILVVLFISLARWPTQAIDNAELRTNLLSVMFACGLSLVALEDIIGMNKSSVMMVLAATMWTFLAVSFHPMKSKAGANILHHEMNRGLEDVGSVILFLLPAMGLVESVDHFDGFAVVTLIIRKVMDGQKHRLMPIMCFLTFMLSSVIDNLTATIVALKLLRHLVADDAEFRRSCGGAVVIAANAGGAWSPIGDVTTTMLWIQGKITAPSTVKWLFLPSFMAGALPLAGIWWRAHGAAAAPAPLQRLGRRRFSELREEASGKTPGRPTEEEPLSRIHGDDAHQQVTSSKIVVLVLCIAFILLVPVLKMWTGLPPYLGMILALGLFWAISDLLGIEDHGSPHQGDGDAEPMKNGVVAALHKVDLSGLLFFTGVLLAVGALDSAGVLREYATMLVQICGPSPVALCTLLGISSAIVDNVPLVEAAIDMFREKTCDDPLWQLVALAAGTGGSILSIGSIAGVTLMSMEDVGFLWYCKRISLWASIGFAMGIVTYQVERALFG